MQHVRLQGFNQVVPHFVCNEKTNLLTDIKVAKTEWSETACLSTGETYHNPDPLTNPLLKKQLTTSVYAIYVLCITSIKQKQEIKVLKH